MIHRLNKETETLKNEMDSRHQNRKQSKSKRRRTRQPETEQTNVDHLSEIQFTLSGQGQQNAMQELDELRQEMKNERLSRCCRTKSTEESIRD
jgi:uncharacterized protein YjaZ